MKNHWLNLHETKQKELYKSNRKWKRMEIMSSSGYSVLKSSYGTSLELKDKEQHRGIRMTSTSGHTIQMVDEGPKDEEQVLPPWNTESYDNIDLPDCAHWDFGDEPEKNKIEYPKIYGFKTPQRHSFRFVDGQPESSS